MFAGGSLYVLGGYLRPPVGSVPDFLRLDRFAADARYTPVPVPVPPAPGAAPPPLAFQGAAAVRNGTAMLVWGGFSTERGAAIDDAVWAFDLGARGKGGRGAGWCKVPTTGASAAGSGSGAAAGPSRFRGALSHI